MTLAELIATILWTFLGIPMIYYPMVLLANIMSLAAPAVQKITLKGILFKVFLVVTSLYPLIYYVCFQSSLTSVKEGDMGYALLYAWPPLTIGGTLFWIIKK